MRRIHYGISKSILVRLLCLPFSGNIHPFIHPYSKTIPGPNTTLITKGFFRARLLGSIQEVSRSDVSVFDDGSALNDLWRPHPLILAKPNQVNLICRLVFSTFALWSLWPTRTRQRVLVETSRTTKSTRLPCGLICLIISFYIDGLKI